MGSCIQCSIEKLKKNFPHSIKFECISGSHAYGTNIETSDIDIRGIFVLPSSEYIGLKTPVEQASDSKSDIVYYNVKRLFELLNSANPTLIELLFMPQECIRIKDPILEPLFENRHLFVTKKTYFSYGAYSLAQIKKAKGQNKRVHNPKPKQRPSREDFCYVIGEDKYRDGWDNFTYGNDMKEFPFRPVPLKDISKNYREMDLSKCHVAAMEQMSNAYRLYYYGDKAKGVFRGDSEVLVCESIPKEDEWEKFIGLLIYNEESYKKEVKEWEQYWEWKNNRNEHRWTDQEKGDLDFDGKNMMHCIRLLWSAENIAINGEPMVRFNGDKLDTLIKIRSGEMTYEQIISLANSISDNMKEKFDKSNLPENVDPQKSNEIYQLIQKKL